MPDRNDETRPGAQWQRAIDLDRLARGGRAAVKVGTRQIAIFSHEGRVHACNNRCPHEGYPLVEGDLDAACQLTCHWHNWKFDLASGVNRDGGDDLRIYPVKLEAGTVWVDLADPPAAQGIARALGQLDAAMDEHDAPRIARELARLERCGADVDGALRHAIGRSHTRLRYGMTHAYAAAEVWLRLRDTRRDEAERLACAAEALSHIAFDSLREPARPFEAGGRDWTATAFLDAVEAQDEARAAALLNGACAAGLSIGTLDATLGEAALAHFNDFGHSLIYLEHLGPLAARLGGAVQRPLLLAWLRSVIHATREDLLPDFRGYAQALQAWPANPSPRPGRVEASAFEGHSVRQCLAATVSAAAESAPLSIHHALMEAAARHLLRFDEAVEQRSDNTLADNVGWLDCTHAITFGHAVRRHCMRHPGRWPQGLLQLAMFVGRNSGYLDAGTSSEQALQRWAVDDVAAFDARCIETVLDPGLALYILPVHRLKTWAAVRDQVALGVPDACASALRAAVNRLFAIRFKQRHVLRTARQALGFVAREG